jgi:hypothetical protein
VFTWTPTASQPGSHLFSVRVSDGVANTDVPITITVSVTSIADLTATPIKSGNDADGTTRILLAWSALPGGHTVEVFRAGFGGYPAYDQAGGSVPATPSYPPATPWTLTPVTASGQTDEPPTRDFYYYVAFVHGDTGVSVASNQTSGTLNYFLGDVSDGATAGQGDNAVNTLDLSLLGAHYGLEGPEVEPFAYLDVGPTSDYSTDGLPSTDGLIDFEDLIVFAISVDAVSAPARPPVAHASDAPSPPGTVAGSLTLSAGAAATVGDTIFCPVTLSSTGLVKGVSIRLAWDSTRVRPLGIDVGPRVAAVGGVALSPKPGTVDAVFVGEPGLAGELVVATVKFATLEAGETGIRVAAVRARDAANRRLDLSVQVHAPPPVLPRATLLAMPTPNPFRGSTTLAFDLAEFSRVDLVLYSVDGRRVRTLIDRAYEPGRYRAVWDGRDDAGRLVAPGVYYAHFVAGSKRFNRTIVILR